MSIEVQKFSSGVLSILPLIYVGWSDSVLSPSEMTQIRKKIADMKHLTSEDIAFFNENMDPLNPPSDREFKLWTREIKKAARNYNPQEKSSLVEMGLFIAQAGKGQGDKTLSNSPKTKAALLELKDSLGLTTESEAILMKRLQPVTKLIKQSYNEPSFDVKKMKAVLDGKEMKVRDRVRRLLRDPAFAMVEDREKEAYRNRIKFQLEKLSEQGLSAYAFPKLYGGLEKNGEHIAVFEMLGYGDLSLAIKFGVQVGLFGGAVLQLGTERHHKKYIEPLHKAQLLGCFAMTETGHGSNVKDLETTATYDHATKSLVINSPSFSAGKEYIGNAMHSTMAAVFAQLIVNGQNNGVHAILVPLRDAQHEELPGIKIEDCGYKMGLNGVDNGRIWFDQVTVPVENLLNKYGDIDESGNYVSSISNPSKRFFTTLGALVVGRICVGMLGLNASKVALTIALKYAYSRRQFSVKGQAEETLLIDYPTHQARLFPLLAKTYAYYLASKDLADKYCKADENEMREVETLAAGLKATATWHATKTIQICRETCGGKGYLSENRFASLKADTDIFTTFEGDNTVLMQLVAKGSLTEYKQSFHDDGYRAVIRFLVTKAKHEAYEYNPLFTRNTDTAHLLDHKFHFHAFKYRNRKILISLGERMQKYIKRGMDGQQTFLKVQQHMMDLAAAFIAEVTLVSFHKHINNCKDAATRKAMETLAQLYALDNIFENRGWYLESDYMDGTKTKAIRRQITKLYQEIKPDALALVDAFAIPDELLSAPIALKEWS